MAERKPPVPEDGIFRAILWAMVLTVMAGAAFAIVGETVYRSQAMVEVGAGVAIVGGALYAFFRWLGAREMKRRQSSGDNGPGA